MVFIRTNGEKTLTKVYQNKLTAQGITFKTSTPYTPEQNSHAERQGHMLAAKARTIRIAANLPQNLWPEAVKATNYITNKTPTKRNQWKTPFKIVTLQPPNLAHLHVYGCKTYIQINMLPRKQKLTKRAHIGYLIGYNSSNIYKIWDTNKNKIIKTRDVTFNENSHYHPTDIDLQSPTISS